MHIIVSPREEESRTLQVTEEFIRGIRQKHPDLVVDELNLAKEVLPALTMKTVSGKYVILAGKELYGELKEAWEEVIGHINRFLSADVYVISTPMWNYSIPYMLKHYIDLIVQPKYAFRFTKEGVEGLAKNKKMIVITSRGGEYSSPEMHAWDHQEPYLRMIFGFIGITDITFVKAEGMDMGEPEEKKKRLDDAKASAKQLADKV